MPVATDGNGNFLTLGEDGKWTPARQAVNPETGQKLIYDGSAWKPESEMVGAQKNETAFPGDNFVRSLARGATMGFADELAAAGGATF